MKQLSAFLPSKYSIFWKQLQRLFVLKNRVIFDSFTDTFLSIDKCSECAILDDGVWSCPDGSGTTALQGTVPGYGKRNLYHGKRSVCLCIQDNSWNRLGILGKYRKEGPRAPGDQVADANLESRHKKKCDGHRSSDPLHPAHQVRSPTKGSRGVTLDWNMRWHCHPPPSSV